ncbi:hypothetical protein Q5752_005652 [Cryptotrichosporon argae]
MIPSPRRTVSQPATGVSSWADFDDDDDGWQDMPVVRSDSNPFGLDEEDQKRFHYRPPARLDLGDGEGDEGGGVATSNATGAHLEVEADTLLTDSWRVKQDQDESDYTRLRLDEDEESDAVHMRTRYLFDEDKAMTPLSQMQATKELLTEGQRIAYVGLCQLIARRMVRDTGRGWEGLKGKAKAKEVHAVESATIWMIKIMARLYQHMELERDEQRMIESLGDHGVDPSDLVPALMTTHTVKNPEFDPEAKRQADIDAARVIVDDAADRGKEEHGSDVGNGSTAAPPPPYERRAPNPFTDDGTAEETRTGDEKVDSTSTVGEEDGQEADGRQAEATKTRPPPLQTLSVTGDDDGDISAALSAPLPSSPLPSAGTTETEVPTPRVELQDIASGTEEAHEVVEAERMPSLPGVSTSLTNADETVTLDIRWTVLCDLFLVLVADSVYDSRSRAFLERVATALGFGWLDVVRFENRVTDALEIQENVGQLQQDAVIQGRAKSAQKKRYAMMGLAAVGGGLVIGLSAGLLAPVIGAGLGAAFATVGITGTTGFLAGAGGAAMITTGGVLTGANIAGKGMAKRTREVRTFELKPLHNNKRVSCYLTVGGFMASKVDDVRLPFSILDSIVGDVFSVLWEPEMMAEMGGALKILTGEVLTQVGQQILQMTIMTGLMSALQWPMILTKLGYLIDNPWSNALDRAKAAGLILADVLIQRHAGVRPTSLIGYSLGARVIFYALCELARVKAYGIVQDVFLFGATVTAPRQTWLEARSVVGGRFVNGFASNDWMLGYLFRATSGGLGTVAGLRPVETVPGLDNVEVTDIITGHMSYRSLMPQLLARVGFPVTADYFDEPDDPELDMSVQERTVVDEAAEEEKKRGKKILGIFPRSRQGSRQASGRSTPVPHGPPLATAPAPAGGAEDNDDLPPREGQDTPPRDADIGDLHAAAESTESVQADDEEEDAQVRAISKTAGFDFAAISKELGKEIDVDRLREPDPRAAGVPLAALSSTIERPESAPPLDAATIACTSIGRSLSAIQPTGEDAAGDITASAPTAARTLSLGEGSDMSSWDGPSPGKVSPVGAGSSKSLFGFNAWSTPSSASFVSTSTSTSNLTLPLRSAPPARPHPPEFMNPFAEPSADAATLPGTLAGARGLGKLSLKDDKMAMENPW